MSSTEKAILIIDDDPDMREALKFSLETQGYRISCAINGQDALSLLQPVTPTSLHPCLIILDLVMPIMSGVEFLSLLHQDPKLICIPVVVISAFEENELRSSQLKVQGFIKKPVDLDILLGWVNRFCGKILI